MKWYIVCLALCLSGCATGAQHDVEAHPYTLTYHSSQEGLQEAREGYGITRTNTINGFWAVRDGVHYVHVLIRGPWVTHQTLLHEEKHVREGSRHG